MLTPLLYDQVVVKLREPDFVLIRLTPLFQIQIVLELG